ncbi:hypothetical protein SS50377_20325 [Spironucleus salmonicida]|uniref:Uncharacterized protein n=1 Tax=Spironucleus salmonicida TaxID=348837 RepID=V6LET4_9EUKA|nr:hypothetical protein SS50377_20325 [Spironucleus salmonicida]|eukprot:EST43007.1 Hypothetical protein SS50377_17308 [Spironucleus salmonicida]
MKLKQKNSPIKRYKIVGILGRLSTLTFFTLMVIAYLVLEQLTCTFSFYTHTLAVRNTRSMIKQTDVIPQITYFNFTETISPLQVNLQQENFPVFIHLDSVEHTIRISSTEKDEVQLLTKTVNRGLKYPYPQFSAVFFDAKPTPPLFYANFSLVPRRPLVCIAETKAAWNATFHIGGKFVSAGILLSRAADIIIENAKFDAPVILDAQDALDIHVANSIVTIDVLNGKAVTLTVRNSTVTIACAPSDSTPCSNFTDYTFDDSTCRRTFQAAVSAASQQSVTVPISRDIDVVYTRDAASLVQVDCADLHIREK